jgi:DNA modification methylase
MTSTVQLYLGDYLDFIKTLPDGSIDAIVTDPPFGIDFQYDEHDDSSATYEVLMKTFVNEAQRLCTNGFIFVWQAMKQASNWHRWFPAGYRIFAGLKNFTQFRPTPIQYSWDPIIFWTMGKPSIVPMAGIRDYHMGNTARYVAEKSFGHPCPRPLDTVTYIITNFTHPQSTILDPFVGSGTTGVACVHTNRNFIGCEISSEYFRITERRIAEAQAQLSLLDLVPTSYTTPDMFTLP